MHAMNTTLLNITNSRVRNASRQGIPKYMFNVEFRLVMLVTYCFVFIMGILGNIFVILAVKTRIRLKKKASSLFIFNLAVADILVILIYIPFSIGNQENGLLWPFGYTVCKYIFNLANIAVTSSVLTLVVVAIDRFKSIVYPLEPRLRQKTAIWIIIILWTISVIVTVPYVYFSTLIKFKSVSSCLVRWPSDEWRKGYWTFMFCFQYGIPMIIMCWAYGTIGFKLKTQRLTECTDSHYGRSAVRARIRSNGKLAKMMILVAACYLILALPYHFAALWFSYDSSARHWIYFPYLAQVSVLAHIVNSSVNWIIYCINSHDYRKAFKLFLLRLLCLNWSPLCNVAPDENGDRRVSTISFQSGSTTLSSSNEAYSSAIRNSEIELDAVASNHRPSRTTIVEFGDEDWKPQEQNCKQTNSE